MALQLMHREETVNNQSGGDMTSRSGKISKATEGRKQELIKASKSQSTFTLSLHLFYKQRDVKQRKEMISHASRGNVGAISEVALNLVKGTLWFQVHHLNA